MIAPIVARLRSLWRAVWKREDFEREMDEEFRQHVAFRTEDLVRAGHSADAAGRLARLEFGPAEAHKHSARSSRGLLGVDHLRVSWLDFKLGFRMLARYPGLTLVGGVSIAFAIAAGVSTFSFVGQVVYPRLPLDEGDRIVGMRGWNTATSRIEPLAPGDVLAWRSGLSSLDDVGAYRSLERNLIAGDGIRGEPAAVAAMQAAGFRLTRVAPLLGRTLLPSDEERGAPQVAVISHGIWQGRFAGDPAILGQTLQLGRTKHVIVGVMPPGFAFPVFHDVWIPLQLQDADRDARSLTRAFGRLSSGKTLGAAQAQLSAINLRLRVARPDSAQRIDVQVLPFASAIFDLSRLEARALMSLNLVAVMFLLIVCSTVAMLMFARAAAREGEIVVRRALGASTSRIVMQLFAEALVLGSIAAAVGIAAAGLVVRLGLQVIEASAGRRPFWFSDTPSPSTLLYAVALTLLVAVVTGVLPALKVTRGLSSRLRENTAGGGGMRFGGVWTAVIIAQVAVTVAFPASTFFVRRDAVQMESLDVGFPDREYLSVQLEADRDTETPGVVDTGTVFAQRMSATMQELERQLEAEPGVAGVTYADLLPRMYHPQRPIEVDEGGTAPTDSVQGHRVSNVTIALDFFQTLGVNMSAGRAFHSGDVRRAVAGYTDGVVIANESFVREVLGGRQAIGRRVRYTEAPDGTALSRADSASAWYEIVGVVKDLGMTHGGDPEVTGAGLYHPLNPGTGFPLRLAIHLRGSDPASFATRVREIATLVDPTLRVEQPLPLDRIQEADVQGINFWFRLLVIGSSLALLLSLAGIYAVMSFTVSRRTREIGIRIALGSDPRRLTASMLARPLAQVGIGIAAGGLLVALLAFSILGPLSPGEVVLVVLYAALMLVVCLLACVLPMRRALNVQPTEALRADV